MITVPILCRVAPAWSVGPFHWALLEALEVFPPGSRLPLPALADRLGLQRPRFLEEAWAELVRRHAVEGRDFLQADLAPTGREALRHGFGLSGPVQEHTRTLAFSAREGIPAAEPAPPTPPHTPPLAAPPRWAERLDRERVVAALASQHPELLPEGHHLLGFRVAWARAHAVS